MKLIVGKDILNIINNYTLIAYKFDMEIKESDDNIFNEVKKLEEQYDNVSLEELINSNIIKEGRDGYKKFGKDPSRYRLACESLCRRLIKKLGLYYINNAVDIGNILSIKIQRPVAVLDYDKIVGDVYLRLGRSDDDYEGIGRGKINVENIPVYVDDISPFGSPTSDTLRTAISKDTKTILLFVNCFSDKYIDSCDQAIRELYKKLGKVDTFEKLNVEYER